MTVLRSLAAANGGLVLLSLIAPAVASGGEVEAPAMVRTYDYADRMVFAVWAAPGRITDIALEPGEMLSGPVAAGDTARWMIGDTTSGAGAGRRVHVLVKPVTAPLATNLLITTDRRAYHIELRATARAWLSDVAWRYPAPPLVTAPSARTILPIVAIPPEPPTLDFGYRLIGDRPRWRPLRVYDDGKRTFIAFADDLAGSVLPPLFRTSADGKDIELIDYRVVGRSLVIDGLIERAELRRGIGRAAQRVQIVRQAQAEAKR